MSRFRHTQARLALAAARLVERVSRRLAGRARALMDPALAARVTAAAYRRHGFYLEPWHQDLGLFDFEEAALAAHFPTPPARLLVIGCGAGRELVALVGRGYACVGVEPDAGFCEAARERLGPSVPIVEAALAALAAPEVAAGPFDGVVLGWGAWGHVYEEAARIAGLAAIRARCPEGPVLLSWASAPRRGLRGRAQTARAVARPPEPPRIDDWPRRLIVHGDGLVTMRLDEADIRREAAAADYEVHYRDPADAGYPSAVLVPGAPIR